MTILFTILLTIFVIILLKIFFVKIGMIYVSKIIKEAINVSCYVNTYHYSKNEEKRVKIGQQRFTEKILSKGSSSFAKEKTDYIFWVFYTQIFNNLLECIPLSINMHNNRCLAEGEQRGMETFLDKYQNEQEDKYKNYLTKKEQQEINDRQCCSENSNV